MSVSIELSEDVKAAVAQMMVDLFQTPGALQVTCSMSFTAGGMVLTPPQAPEEPGETQLVTNGDMSSTDGWTLNGWTFNGGIASSNGSLNPLSRMAAAEMGAGKYLIVLDVASNPDGGDIQVKIGGVARMTVSNPGVHSLEVEIDAPLSQLIEVQDINEVGIGINSLSVTAVAAEAVTLSPLVLSNNNVSEILTEGALVGSINNRTLGSALSLVDSAGERFKLGNGAMTVEVGPTPLDYEASSMHTIVLRETLAGAVNSPRDTSLNIHVTDVAD